VVVVVVVGWVGLKPHQAKNIKALLKKALLSVKCRTMTAETEAYQAQASSTRCCANWHTDGSLLSVG
jgi:hypothetical protein